MLEHAAKLKYLRERKCYSVEHLAEMLGVSATTVMEYETGQRTPRDERKEKLSKILNCSPIELFF